RCPQSEVRHTWLLFKMDVADVSQGMTNAIQQSAQHKRADVFKLSPYLRFSLSLFRWNGRKMNNHGAIKQIASCRKLLDSIQDDRAHRHEQRLFVILVERARGKPATR